MQNKYDIAQMEIDLLKTKDGATAYGNKIGEKRTEN